MQTLVFTRDWLRLNMLMQMLCDQSAHNKALQLDNLRGGACVHARSAPILAHKRHRINCD